MPAEKKKRINSSVKGKVAERELVKIFSAWWEKGTGVPNAFSRTPASGGFATLRKKRGLDALQSEGDLIAPADCPLHLEAKRNEQASLDTAFDATKSNFLAASWRQACLESPPDKTPVLLFRKNGQQWRVAVPIRQEQEVPATLNHAVLTRKFTEAAGLPPASPFVVICLLSEFLEHLTPAAVRGNRQATPASVCRGDAPQLPAAEPVTP